jgi:hypothetical protein
LSLGGTGREPAVSNSDKIEVPDTSIIEKVITGAKAAATVAATLSGIPAPILGPLLGGSIAEALGFFGQREIDKRQTAFAEDVVRGLEDMQAQVSELQASFWTTLLHALEIARRTHQEEKREALKNIVLNAAKPTAPEDDLQHIFLNIVDDLTPLHLRLFGFLLHPELFVMDVASFHELHRLNPNNPRAAWDAIETHVAPSTRRDLIYLCFSDLVNRGLLEYSGDPGPLQGAILPWPTTLGWEFRSFITKHSQESRTSAEGEEQQP